MTDLPPTPDAVDAKTLGGADPHAASTTYITHSIPGIGGVLKQRPEDFLVEETPLYEPAGEGEHIYLFIEKRELTTQQVVSILAQHFGVQRFAIGYAGMKDKIAITRQVFSIHVPGRKIEDYPMLQHDRLSVLWADYHTNKLRIGHLRGNRFSIRVRGVDMSKAVAASRGLALLERVGAPNRIGEQRFGALGNNHIIGRMMILGDFDGAVRVLLGPSETARGANREARELFERGEYDKACETFHHSARAERAVLRGLARGATAAKAFLRLDPSLKGFFLSAFQSVVFNKVLDRRVKTGTIGALQLGDVAIKHANGAVFSVDEAVVAAPETAERLRTFEISPSGPLWGVTMKRASGEIDAAELAALHEEGVTLEDLERFDRSTRDLINGTRRPLRVPVMHPDVEGGIDPHGHYVRCAFELPKGSFATMVMAELMKNVGAEPIDGTDPEHEESVVE